MRTLGNPCQFVLYLTQKAYAYKPGSLLYMVIEIQIADVWFRTSFLGYEFLE